MGDLVLMPDSAADRSFLLLGKMQTKYRNNVMDDSEKWFCVPFFEPLFWAVFCVFFHVTAKSAINADNLKVVFGHFIFSLNLDWKKK